MRYQIKAVQIRLNRRSRKEMKQVYGSSRMPQIEHLRLLLRSTEKSVTVRRAKLSREERKQPKKPKYMHIPK